MQHPLLFFLSFFFIFRLIYSNNKESTATDKDIIELEKKL